MQPQTYRQLVLMLAGEDSGRRHQCFEEERMYPFHGSEVFRFDLSREHDRVVVALHGELDIANARRLRESFAALSDGTEREVIVDLSGVPFIDSTCLAVLLWASNRCREQRRQMVLRAPTRGVLATLAASGLLRAFRYDPTTLDGDQPWPTRMPAAQSPSSSAAELTAAELTAAR